MHDGTQERGGELKTREHVVKRHQDQIRQARSGPARGLSQQRINQARNTTTHAPLRPMKHIEHLFSHAINCLKEINVRENRHQVSLARTTWGVQISAPKNAPQSSQTAGCVEVS